MDVPMSFYKDHRDTLVKNVQEQIKPAKNSYIFMVGIPTIHQDD